MSAYGAFSVLFYAESSKFSYMPGKIYEYAYESNSRTTIPGSTEEIAGLQMRANVQLAVASACEMAVKVKPVDTFLLPVTLRPQRIIRIYILQMRNNLIHHHQINVCVTPISLKRYIAHLTLCYHDLFKIFYCFIKYMHVSLS